MVQDSERKESAWVQWQWGFGLVSWHQPLLIGYTIGKLHTTALCALVAALLVKAERCCRGEHHIKKTIVLNCFKPRLGKRTLGRGSLYHFYASSWGQIQWNDLRKHKIQATSLNASFQSTVRGLAHCGGEREILQEHKESLLFLFCFFSTNRSPFLWGVVVSPGDGSLKSDPDPVGGVCFGPAWPEQEVQELQHR